MIVLMITPSMIATATLYLRFTYAICLIIAIVGTVLAIRRHIRRARQFVEDRKEAKRRRDTSVAPATTNE